MGGDGGRRNGGASQGVRLRRALTAAEFEAVRLLLRRVRGQVRARLVHASLFGSKARGEARPDSDVDVLLVFHRLPRDREPQATHAERIASEVADATGVPVTVWSVSLPDLWPGARTPMLVDALHDSIPLWWEERPLPAVGFTPADADRCVRALLARVEEGGHEFAEHLARGERQPALRRLRDDLIRLCTAFLLLRGITRPRRGEAAAAFLRHAAPPSLSPCTRSTLRWASSAFGPDGRDEEIELGAPPAGAAGGARAVDELRDALLHAHKHLFGAGGGAGNLREGRAYR